MATYKITQAASVYETGSGAFAFQDKGTFGIADTLTVDASAYLISTNNGTGVGLYDTGAWTLNIQGQVLGLGAAGRGVVANMGSATTFKATIGAAGGVFGGQYGIF